MEVMVGAESTTVTVLVTWVAELPASSVHVKVTSYAWATLVFTSLDTAIRDEMSPSVSSSHVAPSSTYVVPTPTLTADWPTSVITGGVSSTGAVTV